MINFFELMEQFWQAWQQYCDVSIVYVCFCRIVEVLITQFKSKNSLVRLRIASYFEIII